MKIVAKPVDMVCWFEKTGIPHPIRFKMTNPENEVIVKIDRVLTTDKEKLAGNEMLIFQCQSTVDGTQKLYELKYELSTCKWILFKI